jgi:hypothetical protein
MHRTHLPLALASIFATGCSHAALVSKTAASSSTSQNAETAAEVEGGGAEERTPRATTPEATAQGDTKSAAAEPEADTRKPGDYVVYRFSGSFRKTPLVLTERVVDRKGALLTIDVTAEAGDQKRELRVKIDDAPFAKNEVVSVARLEGGTEKPANLDAYEALMAETTLAADQNEAFLGVEDVVLDLGGTLLPCRKASYRVRVGKRQATLHTLASDGFAWGDVGGEITAASGKVLYRAEVVEVGRAAPTQGTAVANSNAAP